MNFLKATIILLLLSIQSFLASGQNGLPKYNNQIAAINKYVEFLNESSHGMFLANRLLIENNIDINKYVDLESEKINNYSNKDLPKDIFEDKDHWFYEISPYDLLTQAKSKATALKQSESTYLNGACDKIQIIIKATNQLRLDMDLVTVGVDLSQKPNLDKVYLKLEEGVKLFDDYLKLSSEIEKYIDGLRAGYTDVSAEQLTIYESMKSAINSQKAAMTRIRTKQSQYFDQIIAQLSQDANKLKGQKFINLNPTMSSKISFSQSNIIKALDEFNSSAALFDKNESIPSKYKYYGRFYYFYNVLVSKFNKYGTGLAFELNQIINFSKLPLIKFVEQPHLFQVIYPKKIVEKEATKSSTDLVTVLPTSVKERKVSGSKQIRVDQGVVELELYDHMITDGDIVSINFNGDWILEKEELEKGSKIVKLQLNPTGKNFILLHADSVGKRPPNTTGIRYYFKGERRDIVLKSDNNYSELIEIVIVK